MARKPLTPDMIEDAAGALVRDLETSILEDIMDFQGTREELEALIQAVKDNINSINVDALFNELAN